MEGIIHSIESLAAVDGEGLRCCVFFAGCPLRCAYCHNPDTWKMEGTRITPETLVKKIARFKTYFGENGGVTFSGGEPLLHAEFLCETVPLLKREQIPYILDTSGQVLLSESVMFLLKEAQGVLLDLKFWDDDSYRTYTGVGIQRTLDMLHALNEIGTKTVLRTVIIPEVNDTKEHIAAYLDLFRGISCVSRYELLSFHTMGFFKYEKLGIKNPFAGKSALSAEKRIELQEFADLKRKNG
ncbi:MAG: radical SAM protein [Ruminococcaceae bacterium]|nr:radical SAM protein [Oscillospiraceae bacterium]